MERLRELREQRNLTLRELEHLSGVSKDAISEIERGLRHPRTSTLRKLAEGLGVSVQVLQGTVSHGTIGAYTAIYEPGENGWVVASCPDVPGTITQGRTIEEARDNLKDAIRLMREVMREDAEKGLEGREILREVIEV
jgi:transcriptional regulator with XRE-family HTH domain